MRELPLTVEIVAEDMAIDSDRMIVTPGRRMHDDKVLAARAACTLTLHRFGHSWPAIAIEFGTATHAGLYEQAKQATAGRFAGLYPDGQAVDEYAESVRERVAGRLGGAA